MLKFFTSYNKKNAYETQKGKDVFAEGISKTARNEYRKYAATFYNNTSVALFAAGFLIPIFGVAHKMIILAKDDYNAGRYYDISLPLDVSSVCLASTLAFLIGMRLRSLSNRCLLTLED